MKRLDKLFSALKVEKEKALVVYITAGDPDRESTLNFMHTLADSGADILEIGFPFSEPMADGPVIQRAMARSLRKGTSLEEVLQIIATFRSKNTTTPIVLMGYLNPIYRMGYQNFADKAAAAGIDATLIVDCPFDMMGDLKKELEKKAMDPIFLLAPTSTETRVKMLGKAARGFLYYVSLKGVTGSSVLDTKAVEKKLAQIKREVNCPVVVGFGIHSQEEAAEVARFADGIVVGSRIVALIEEQGRQAASAMASVTRELKAVTHHL